jgi:uracil-DNA glycosylase
MKLPAAWKEVVGDELAKPYFQELEAFLTEERQQGDVFPPDEQVFTALELTPFSDVGVVILGQDPYHGKGQAHGLSFSVLPGVKPPPSLKNIYKELQDDVGCSPVKHGCLIPWARQGVLMLNTVMTVRAGKPGSHRGRGWELFTDGLLRRLVARPQPAIFVLWGKDAQAKLTLLQGGDHLILQAAHPSPFSAHNGFFGCRHFSQANTQLKTWGRPEIDWQLPDKVEV